jgi:hypothetical protein
MSGGSVSFAGFGAPRMGGDRTTGGILALRRQEPMVCQPELDNVAISCPLCYQKG